MSSLLFFMTFAQDCRICVCGRHHSYTCFATKHLTLSIRGRIPLGFMEGRLFPRPVMVLLAGIYFPSSLIARVTMRHSSGLWNTRESWQRRFWEISLYSLIKKGKGSPGGFSPPWLFSSPPQFSAFEYNCDFWNLKPSWDHRATGIVVESQHAKFYLSILWSNKNLTISVDYNNKYLFPCSRLCELSPVLLGSPEIGWA